MQKRTFINVCISVLPILVIAGLVWLNMRVYSVPKGAATLGELAEDAVPQLNNIGRRLRAGEGTAMQRLFPEGWFFSHALYGFAWLNVGFQTRDLELKQRAATEARWVLGRMDTPEGLAPFRATTQLEDGVFYLAWKNRLVGGLLVMLAEAEHRPTEIALFHRQSESLAAAFNATPTLHLDAYSGQTWPCDNVMALASLKLHDQLYGTHYQEIADRWVAFTKQHLDADTGLIVHQIDGRTGNTVIAARASSQAYIHALLPELSTDFAREQYAGFRRTFVVDWLGYLPLREYPKGKSGHGDVDTGPLILGISPSATTASIAAARANGDYELCERSVILSETVGLPWTRDGEKSFGFGQIIVADTLLVWGKTLIPWSRTPAVQFPATTPSWWRRRLHGLSALGIGVGIFFLTRIWKRKAVSNRPSETQGPASPFRVR